MLHIEVKFPNGTLTGFDASEYLSKPKLGSVRFETSAGHKRFYLSDVEDIFITSSVRPNRAMKRIRGFGHIIDQVRQYYPGAEDEENGEGFVVVDKLGGTDPLAKGSTAQEAWSAALGALDPSQSQDLPSKRAA